MIFHDLLSVASNNETFLQRSAFFMNCCPIVAHPDHGVTTFIHIFYAPLASEDLKSKAVLDFITELEAAE